MNSIILCEGKTDAILTSYYLDSVYGWKYLSKNKPLDIKIRDKQSEELNWYKLNNKKLCIWGVGGVDNFEYAINHIISLNRLANEDQLFDKLIIIADRDDEENNDNIISKYIDILKNNKIEVNLQLNKMQQSTYENDIEDTLNIEIGLVVLPVETKGAIETFLLEALSENKDEKYIIENVRAFINSIESNKYLRKRRERIKAELGTTFALISPDKVFTSLHSLLCEIPWSNYTTFQEGFKILEKL